VSFGKSGLGFNPKSKNSGILKPFSTIAEKQPIEKSKQSVVSCFYCMRKGYFVRYCRIQKNSVPKGILKWVPKNSKVPNVPINTHGLKFIKGPNLTT